MSISSNVHFISAVSILFLGSVTGLACALARGVRNAKAVIQSTFLPVTTLNSTLTKADLENLVKANTPLARGVRNACLLACLSCQFLSTFLPRGLAFKSFKYEYQRLECAAGMR